MKDYRVTKTHLGYYIVKSRTERNTILISVKREHELTDKERQYLLDKTEV